MFLKRLDLYGFKSFADHIELEIAPGVTAVVGPNGSGKSNISDAIRWVLGEQSARSLRGAKMEDVIFSGSQTRKSVNFCEVTLTLDNRQAILPVDYAEVSVTRRVYRSGDSEYLINKTPCRLRDIAELFMDTGVGREAYSIIGQGRIEEILSTRSDERRGVFEEAAGIVKFKSKRREAERKLTEADQNLIRINDVLAELEDQVESLAHKAEIAKKYKETFRFAERLHIMVLAAEIGELSLKRSAFVVEVTALQQKFTMQEAKEAESVANLARIKNEFEKVEVEFADLSQQFVEATARVEQCEADRRVTFERQEHTLVQLEELRNQRERIASQQVSLEASMTENQEQLSELERRVDQLRKEVRSKLDEQDGHGVIAQLRSRIAESRAVMIEVMRRQATERNEQKTLLQERDKRLQMLERYSGELVGFETAAKRLRESGAQSAQQIQQFEEAAKELGLQLESIYHDLEKEEQTLAQCVATIERLERQKIDISSRHRTLQELQRDLDGYASGPKVILRARQKEELSGIYGVVADLVRVAKDYELAIEIALGGSLQHVVVEMENDARLAIEFLKKRQLGRATFLPVSAISGRRLSSRDYHMIAQEQGFVGLASDLVETEPLFKAIVESLLGHVVVTEQLAQANGIAKLLHYRVRIVTIGGDVVNTGGSMTGGSTGKRGVALLGRAREIEALQEQAHKVSTQLENVKRNQRECIEQVRALRNQQATIQAELGRIMEQVRAKELGQNRLDAESKALDGRIQLIMQEKELMQAELRSYDVQLSELESTLQTISNEGNHCETEIKALEEEMVGEEAKVSGHTHALTELRVTLAEQEEALRGKQSAREQLAAQMAALSAESERLDREQQTTIARVTQLQEKLQVDEQNAGEALQARKRLGLVVEAQRNDRASLLQQMESSDHFCQVIRAEAGRLRQKVHQIDVSLSKLDGELETRSGNLRSQYELGYELAQQRYPLEESLDRARMKLGSLRAELDELGDVNIGAIEEFDRVSERCVFLQSEASDLIQAKEQLSSLIADIETEMAHRFIDMFEKIRIHFREVFQSLFQGGKADVFLVDESDPLQTGIEITAEPPGKKMQTLSLLSGGERALTALALLFAILHVKPVPFCVLDEVEAALDEANVSRFAQYLQSFASKTQFVVITHRRGTMEAADVLYGVTMQDSGVSKLVSVRVLEEETASA